MRNLVVSSKVGIITHHSIVFIITGEDGLEHGYADRMCADGVFEYFGKRQIGGMTMQHGNLAITFTFSK